MEEQSNLPVLFTYDSSNRERKWRVWAEGSTVWVASGLIDGKQNTKSYEAKPKNVGRANETTAGEQALLECKSKWNKQKDKNYHEDLAYAVQIENPMLAYPYKAKLHMLKFPCAAQPKLDGVRCLIKREGSQIIYKSRGNKLYTTLGHLDTMTHRLLDLLPEGAMLDGEIYIHGTPLNEITGAVKKTREITSNLEFWWYDVVLEGVDYEGRLGVMSDIMTRVRGEDGYMNSLVSTNTNTLKSPDDIQVLHDLYVSQGFEGLMLKNLAGMYRLNTRSVDLLKYKEMQDAEFKIIGYKLDKDDLIVLICEKHDGSGTFDVVAKGGHDFRREVLRTYQEDYHEKQYKVQFQGWGVNKAPQFPVGLGVREVDDEGNVL